MARFLSLFGTRRESSEMTTNERQRELEQLERLKQAQIEEAKRRVEWIDNEKSIILREHTK